MPATPPKVRRWNCQEFRRLGELGFFENQIVQLIEGEIIELGSRGDEHQPAVQRTADALGRAFGSGYVVRVQAPLQVGQESQPLPDIAVISASAKGNEPATSALLVVEISDASLPFDRGDKASLYASANIPDYWILNMQEHWLEAHRSPVAETNARFGFAYRDKRIVQRENRIRPQSCPTEIAVAEIFG